MITCAELPTLAYLLGSTTAEKLFSDYWEKRPLLIRRDDPNHFARLLDRRRIQRLVENTSVSPRDLRAVKDGSVDPNLTIFTSAGTANPVAVMGAYAGGFTIILNNLQCRNREISYLCRTLELVFRQPVGANAYLTPPQSRGLAVHFDDHDVFVLQIEGSKRWRIFEGARDLPLRGDNAHSGPIQAGELLSTYDLQPGDLLYLPRGIAHDATTLEGSSLHLTLGLSCFRRVDLFARAIEFQARRDRSWRKSLPAMQDPSSRDSGEGSNDSISLQLPLMAARMSMEIDFISTLRPLEDEGLEHIDALVSLNLGVSMRHRVGTVCHVEELPGEARIHFPGNIVAAPLPVAGVLRFIAEQKVFAIGDLPDLDDDSKVKLARKLVTAGMLVPLWGG